MTSKRQLFVTARFATNLLTILPYTPMATAMLPCYYPNGYSPPSDNIEYVACDYSNSGTRMCCATNRPNPSGGNFSNGLTADKCLENGLCMNTGYHADGTHWTNYWRDLCTSNDWSAGGCLDVCTDEKNNGSFTGTVEMTPCDGSANSTSWCCGWYNTACCNTPDAIHVDRFFAQSASHHSVANSSSPTNSSSAAGSSSTTSSSSPGSASGMSTGTKAAIGGGVTAGALSVIALVFFFLKWQQRRSKGQAFLNVKAKGPFELAWAPSHGKPVGLENTIYEKPTAQEMSHEKPADSSATRYELTA